MSILNDIFFIIFLISVFLIGWILFTSAIFYITKWLINNVWFREERKPKHNKEKICLSCGKYPIVAGRETCVDYSH